MAEAPDRLNCDRSSSAALAADPTIDHSVPSARAPSDPEQIGAFRILERVGEGGTGIVYKAEQREPVRRIVALKIVKPGMDTREVVARFEAERQALAMLSHPMVARVFEAGTTDNGRPYFVMEYVAGMPFTQYCDQSRFTTRQRLELFIPICQAIQHAHQKGIIHRDLKPTNILVTLVDNKPVPKVIDFGIAKATNQALTQHTLFTQTGALIGTPEYMSPEQAMTSGLDVDTRTDIYSLGVILYELLTGTLPLDPKTLRAAGLEGMARLIKTIEPQKPSTRLTVRCGDAKSNTNSAANRNTRLLQKELRGDLDWVVLKAMEKDRSRRYETANALAMDLQRHLDNEPVLARPPSTFYRTQKFVRKHRVIVAAAATVALVLVAGVATSTALYLNSVAAERRTASALAALRSTAPTYISQARSLFAEQKSSEALASVEFALRLDPENADYNLLRAHKLEAMGRLSEAIESYGKVLVLRPADSSARSNLELCQKLQKTALPSGQLPSASSIALLTALASEQRTEDLWPLERAVGREAEANRSLIVSRTKNLQSLSRWNDDRIVQLNDGTFRIDLSGLDATDLVWVAGLPISEMNLDRTQIIDISPLSGLPLRKLSMNWTKVGDLGPLRGKPISELQLSMTAVSDLSPLLGMPLETLTLTLCGNIENISPLNGLPLTELRLSQCLKIADYSPLSQCTSLQRLVLPAGFQDIGLLRKLPNLKKVVLDDSTAQIDWETVQPIDLFLPLLERRLARDAARLKELHTALGRLGMPEDRATSIRFSADGSLSLDLQNYPIADLSFLNGLRIRELFLRAPNNRFSDLSPLADMPIWNIGIVGSQMTDLSPLSRCPLSVFRLKDCRSVQDIAALKGLHLHNVALENTGVANLAPLAGCATLEQLFINSSPISDLSPLARCTNLRELGADRCPITGLSPLANLTALRTLDLENTQVQDLRPIANLKLRVLRIGGTHINDCSPLKNMTTLEDLSATGLPIEDLSLLSGCSKLRMLYIGQIPATDLTPICHLPLNTLYLDGSRIADVSSLAECKTLEHLIIPKDAKGIESLRKHSRLKRLSYTWDSKRFRVAQTVAEFWAEFDKAQAR